MLYAGDCADYAPRTVGCQAVNTEGEQRVLIYNETVQQQCYPSIILVYLKRISSRIICFTNAYSFVIVAIFFLLSSFLGFIYNFHITMLYDLLLL